MNSHFRDRIWLQLPPSYTGEARLSYRFRIHLRDFVLHFFQFGSSDTTPSLAFQLFLVLLHALNESTFHPSFVSVSVEEHRDGDDGYLYQAQ